MQKLPPDAQFSDDPEGGEGEGGGGEGAVAGAGGGRGFSLYPYFISYRMVSSAVGWQSLPSPEKSRLHSNEL